MARILFIHRVLRQEELGIPYLSAALRDAGHEPFFIQAEHQDPEEAVRQYRPEFVCYSVITGSHGYFLELNRRLKTSSRFMAVFGGPHCTFFPEIAREPGVDMIIRGPGEKALVRAVEGERFNSEVIQDIPESIDAIAFPDRSILYQYPELRDNPMKNIITMRECPYHCSYCFNHQFQTLYRDQKHRMFQRRSVDNVLAEVEAIRSRYPLEKVLFLDDNFLIQPAWVDEFIRRWPKDAGMPFLVSLRIDTLTEERVRELKQAGLEMVNFALESADPRVRQNILKRGGQYDNAHVARVLEWFSRHQIRSRMQNMIGLPIPNALDDALNSLRFNRDHPPSDSWVAIFQPYPGTQLARYAVEKGYCQPDVVAQCDPGFYGHSRLILPDREKIERLQKWWTFIVRHQLPDELVDILLELPLTEQQAERLVALRFKQSRERLYGIQFASEKI